jgi:hypothetical protein
MEEIRRRTRLIWECQKRLVSRGCGAYGDGCLVHAASAPGEVDVHDHCHGKRSQVHGHGRSDQHARPKPRLGDLNLLLAVLGPIVCQINQQNEPNKQEQTSANHRKVVAPDNEERVWNEKRQDHHADPAHDLGHPEAVLDGRAAVLGRPHSNKHERHEHVEEAKGEVDALHGNVAVALLAVALDVDVVKREVGEFLHGPVREHDPRNDGVDEEDERVGDAGGDATMSSVCAPHTVPISRSVSIPVAALSAARAHHRAARRSSAAGGGNAPYLVLSAARSHGDTASTYGAHGGHRKERKRQERAHDCDMARVGVWLAMRWGTRLCMTFRALACASAAPSFPPSPVVLSPTRCRDRCLDSPGMPAMSPCVT